MAKITFKGNTLQTYGTLPKVGEIAPAFTLTKGDLTDISLQELLGQYLILNIFPSLDTPTCATSVRRFNQEITQHQNAHVLCISADLPFAQKRFCTTEGTERVTPLSDFRHKEFGEDYGVKILDSALAGLLARAVVVLNPKGKVLYTEQVAEITQEPNYAQALQALKE